ncbi:hypothetical protein LNP41_17770, partial [Acinetobacter baumannii]|nr:hypothetical protein [Acinetobacter baumannii]MCC8296645.1 hypothetical protein [Acinetobacter baumannii]
MNKSKFSYAVDFNNEIVGTLSAKEYFSIVKKAYTDLVFLTLYTTNFTEPLSYQGSAFLKLP